MKQYLGLFLLLLLILVVLAELLFMVLIYLEP